MDWEERLTADNLNAAWLAQELGEIKGIIVNPDEVETNILRIQFEPKTMKQLNFDYFKFRDRLKEDHKILANAGFANNYMRFVTHRDVSRADCEKLVRSVKQLVNP